MYAVQRVVWVYCGYRYWHKMYAVQRVVWVYCGYRYWHKMCDVEHVVLVYCGYRYWHKEENGCRWLLQINEKSQSIVFFLIQPVAGLFYTSFCPCVFV